MNDGIMPMTILLVYHKNQSKLYVTIYVCVHVLMLFTFKANKTLILCFPFGYFGSHIFGEATGHKHHTAPI